ncbi:MAG: amidohydrolase family protein [Candidatus Glassbacteria bacterium]|nr:amidohydrolase family protein [Candidatus Glassbacteria bacterium]
MPGKDSLYQDLRGEIAGMKVIDTHEHITSERSRLQGLESPFNLGYAGCDLCGAGASDEEARLAEEPSLDPMAAAQVFLKYYPHTRTTGYGRSMARTLRDVFGIDRLGEESFGELWEKIRTGIGPGSYSRWFRERYNIEAVILDVDNDDEYPDFFHHSLRHARYFIMVDNRDDLEELEWRSGCSIHSAAQLRDAMWSYLERLVESKKAVALKNNLAYNRSLSFERTTAADADRAFSLLFARKHQHHAGSWLKTQHRSWEEMAPLQNFLVHESVRFAEEHGLAYQLHTGLHAGYTNEIPGSRPGLLVNLFREYRKVRFVLFHGGFPYCREWGVLGKNFPNVYLDLCWMHIISPATCVQMLDEWLDYVPNNKILGFGGDLHLVESIHGHLEQARDNIARALAAKVARGDYDRKTAGEIAWNLLYRNPRKLYGLD